MRKKMGERRPTDGEGSYCRLGGLERPLGKCDISATISGRKGARNAKIWKKNIYVAREKSRVLEVGTSLCLHSAVTVSDPGTELG